MIWKRNEESLTASEALELKPDFVEATYQKRKLSVGLERYDLAVTVFNWNN